MIDDAKLDPPPRVQIVQAPGGQQPLQDELMDLIVVRDPNCHKTSQWVRDPSKQGTQLDQGFLIERSLINFPSLRGLVGPRRVDDNRAIA